MNSGIRLRDLIVGLIICILAAIFGFYVAKRVAKKHIKRQREKEA